MPPLRRGKWLNNYFVFAQSFVKYRLNIEKLRLILLFIITFGANCSLYDRLMSSPRSTPSAVMYIHRLDESFLLPRPREFNYNAVGSYEQRLQSADPGLGRVA